MVAFSLSDSFDSFFSLFFLFFVFLILCVLICSSLGWPVWDSLYFLDLSDLFLSQVRDAFSYYPSNMFTAPFSLSLFSFWDPYNADVSALDVVIEVS